MRSSSPAYSEPTLQRELLGFPGHTVRLYQQEVSYPGSRKKGYPLYLVTVDSTDLEDARWHWDMSLTRAAGSSFLELAGYDWK